jgi:cytochrome c551
MKKAALLVCILTLLGIQTACGGNEKTQTPAPAAGTAGGTGGTAATVDVQSLYKANCVGCHGDNLEGRMGGNTNLTQVGARRTKEEITNRITNGGNGMPAFKGRLKDADITALADWLGTKK